MVARNLLNSLTSASVGTAEAETHVARDLARIVKFKNINWPKGAMIFLKSAAASIALLLSSTAMAEERKVQLLSSDGTIKIEGDLISVTDSYYLIQTELGDLRVGFDRVVCQGAACPATEEFEIDATIGGSDLLAQGLMPLLIGGYATAKGAESTVENESTVGNFSAELIGEDGFGDSIGVYRIISNTTAGALEGLLSNEIQIGLASRRITPTEARALRDAGAGNMVAPKQEHIIAVDSLVSIVNPSNPLTELTFDQLADIYSGRVTNWADVGGESLAIDVVRRAPDSGELQVFNTTVFGKPEPIAGPRALEAADNVEAALFVAENPGAIAYVGHAFKRGQKPLSLVSECGIGTSPDVFSVKTEEYTMFRRLYMYNRSDIENVQASDFLDFVKSDDASIVIQQAGFIDLAVERATYGGASERAQRLAASSGDQFEQGFVDEMLAQLSTHDRLSSTFRFRTGSTRLDPRAEVDLLRLVAYLETLPAGSEITLTGFADSVGAFEPNLALSRTRAEQVAARLTEIGGSALEGITINAVGFGEVAPVACNSSDSGRTINRRVETWVKNG